MQITEALGWGRRPGQGGYSNDTGEGGVKGRWSLKLNGVEPFKSLYVVPEGGIPVSARSWTNLPAPRVVLIF